jgi:hypothetical protein
MSPCPKYDEIKLLMISGRSEPREAIINPMVKVLSPIICAKLSICSTALSLETININPPKSNPRIACQINIAIRGKYRIKKDY